jgi:hypothetical protein
MHNVDAAPSLTKAMKKGESGRAEKVSSGNVRNWESEKVTK